MGAAPAVRAAEKSRTLSKLGRMGTKARKELMAALINQMHAIFEKYLKIKAEYKLQIPDSLCARVDTTHPVVSSHSHRCAVLCCGV